MEICARKKTGNDHEFTRYSTWHCIFIITQAQTSGFEAFLSKQFLEPMVQFEFLTVFRICMEQLEVHPRWRQDSFFIRGRFPLY